MVTTVDEKPVMAKSRNRRGISNTTQATAQLKFHEKDATQYGLFVGHLDNVQVATSIADENNKSFAGINVPRITFYFASNHANVVEQRHINHTLFPVESNVNTIPGGSEAWKVDCVLRWIKHILDVYYLKGRELTVEEEDALCLPFEDSDENGQYIDVDAETVAAGYGTLFTNVAAMLNGTFGTKDGDAAKPVYKTADGKYIPCWLKLLRHKRRKNDWINVAPNGELGFDSFLGNGALELVKQNCPPAILRIDFAKESITPKETKKAPSIGVPNSSIAGMGGIPVAPFASTDLSGTDAYAATQEDSPF